ncbi:MAG: hypothetical protein ABSB24_19930, partial [Gaiellaceae bacterium]
PGVNAVVGLNTTLAFGSMEGKTRCYSTPTTDPVRRRTSPFAGKTTRMRTPSPLHEGAWTPRRRRRPRAAATDDLRESLDHLRIELRLTPRPDATPTIPNTSNQAQIEHIADAVT